MHEVRGRSRNKVSDTQHIVVYLSHERYESKKPSKLHLKSNHIKNTCIGVLVCGAHEKLKSKELPLIIIVQRSTNTTADINIQRFH